MNGVTGEWVEARSVWLGALMSITGDRESGFRFETRNFYLHEEDNANPHQSRPRQATSREAEQGGDGLDQYLVGPPPVPQQESPPDLIVMESPSQTTNAADDEERREREAPMILMT